MDRALRIPNQLDTNSSVPRPSLQQASSWDAADGCELSLALTSPPPNASILRTSFTSASSSADCAVVVCS